MFKNKQTKKHIGYVWALNSARCTEGNIASLNFFKMTRFKSIYRIIRSSSAVMYCLAFYIGSSGFTKVNFDLFIAIVPHNFRKRVQISIAFVVKHFSDYLHA